jgi:hypothetical protein
MSEGFDVLVLHVADGWQAHASDRFRREDPLSDLQEPSTGGWCGSVARLGFAAVKSLGDSNPVRRAELIN